jgi:50S ribosomal protein L16 3-hydroxylase
MKARPSTATDPWLDALAEDAYALPALREQLADPATRATRHPARLPATMIENAHRRLGALRPTRAHAVAALLAVLSEPKPVVRFSPPVRRATLAAFARAACTRGLQLDSRTRLLYAAGRIGINGEVLALPAEQRVAIAGLADGRALRPAQCVRLSETLLHRLYEWYVAGWLHAG